MASTSLTLSMLPARRLPSGSGQVWLTSGAASARSSSLARPTRMASLSACLKLSPCWVRCRSSRMAKSSSRVTVVLMASNHNVLDDLMTTSHLASLIGLERRVPRMEHAGPESFLRVRRHDRGHTRLRRSPARAPSSRSLMKPAGCHDQHKPTHNLRRPTNARDSPYEQNPQVKGISLGSRDRTRTYNLPVNRRSVVS